MESRIATHFEDLRHRFPAESGPWITNAQQSFEAMELVATTRRPPQSRSAYLEIGGISYLIWEMDEPSDAYQVFATIYAIPLGIIRLSSKPSGTIVVAGFYIDLAALALSITAHFQKVRLEAETNPNANGAKRKLLLFGFTESFGHNFWNEVSGLVSAMETGLFENLDGIILGPFDYFNLGSLLQSKGKQVWQIKARGSLVTPDRLVIYRNNVVAKETRNLVLANAATHDSHQNKRATLTICFQIRRHYRVWIHEEDGLFEIIMACAREWPEAVFIIDGHSTSKGTIPIKQKQISEEAAFAARLVRRLGGLVDLRSTIGMDINDKINILKNVDLFVGPTGSGGVLSSWLLRKPTITYGPTTTHDLVNHQELFVPEGGPMVFAVSPDHITDMGDEPLSFDVHTGAILNLIQHVIERQLRSPSDLERIA